jgi:hypothetical protein
MSTAAVLGAEAKNGWFDDFSADIGIPPGDSAPICAANRWYSAREKLFWDVPAQLVVARCMAA